MRPSYASKQPRRHASLEHSLVASVALIALLLTAAVMPILLGCTTGWIHHDAQRMALWGLCHLWPGTLNCK